MSDLCRINATRAFLQCQAYFQLVSNAVYKLCRY